MPRPSLRLAVIALATALAAAPACAQGVPAAVLSDYQAKLAQYLQARQAYDAEADAYWTAVVEKRRTRNAKRRDHLPIGLADYVLTQPPLYTGPRRPIDPQAPGPPPSERPPIPVVADFLQAAAEQYNFVPQRPANDLDFKRAYARAARAAGLTREQIVGVYAFETGGRGVYDTQAGLEPPGPGKHAVSPATRLQSVAQHQFSVDPGRARRPRSGGTAAKGQGARRRRQGSRWSARSRR